MVDGQAAFVVNTGTATISSYGVNSDGSLSLLHPVAANTGPNTAPIDLAATADGAFIYVIKSAVGGLAGYAVQGSFLKPIFNKAVLPLSSQGIVAR